MNRAIAATGMDREEVGFFVNVYGDAGWTVAAMGYVEGQGYYVAMNRPEEDR